MLENFADNRMKGRGGARAALAGYVNGWVSRMRRHRRNIARASTLERKTGRTPMEDGERRFLGCRIRLDAMELERHAVQVGQLLGRVNARFRELGIDEIPTPALLRREQQRTAE